MEKIRDFWELKKFCAINKKKKKAAYRGPLHSFTTCQLKTSLQPCHRHITTMSTMSTMSTMPTLSPPCHITSMSTHHHHHADCHRRHLANAR